MKTEKENKNINHDELIKLVEAAAKKGAKEGAKGGFGTGLLKQITGPLLKILVPLIVVILAVTILMPAMSPFSSLFEKEEAVAGHDVTLENHSILGYTVADFGDVIMKKAKRQKKIEVYSRELSEVATLTDAGFAKLKIFSKSQIITYSGTAIYTIDMSKVGMLNIKMDKENKVITILIPHAQLTVLDVPEEKIKYGEVEKGALAMGKIKGTPEQIADVKAEAKKKMQQKLEDENASAEADRYAKLSVLEIYQPVIKGVDRSYSLEIDFQDK